MPSRERNEHIFERRRVRAQFGHLHTMARKVGQQRGHCAMQFGDLELIAPTVPPHSHNSIQLRESAQIRS